MEGVRFWGCLEACAECSFCCTSQTGSTIPPTLPWMWPTESQHQHQHSPEQLEKRTLGPQIHKLRVWDHNIFLKDQCPQALHILLVFGKTQIKDKRLCIMYVISSNPPLPLDITGFHIKLLNCHPQIWSLTSETRLASSHMSSWLFPKEWQAYITQPCQGSHGACWWAKVPSTTPQLSDFPACEDKNVWKGKWQQESVGLRKNGALIFTLWLSSVTRDSEKGLSVTSNGVENVPSWHL